jgi:hypothetical protein
LRLPLAGANRSDWDIRAERATSAGWNQKGKALVNRQ